MAKSREDLLKATERRYADFQGYRFQSLNDLEWSSWESGKFNYDKAKVDTAWMKEQRRRLLVKVLVDDSGARLFADSEFTLLAGLDAGLVGDLYDFAMEHCGFTDSEKEVDDERKNCCGTQDCD